MNKKRILAFAGSNHSASINHQLINCIASQLETDHDVEVIDMRDWKVPMYSIDMDPDETPELISQLIDQIEESDALIIASPEHNGGPSAFLKNILDWLSRRSKKIYEGKKIMLLSTSPGGSGGGTHLEYFRKSLPYFGGEITCSFSLPSFFDSLKEGVLVAEQQELLDKELETLKSAINN